MNPPQYMIGKSTYNAARNVAAAVESHFGQHLEEARQRGEEDLAPRPSACIIETMIDTAFWASLRREEGIVPKISLVFLPPDQASTPLLFERRLPFKPAILTKLAPGVERPGIHLGVWYEEDELYLWGTVRDLKSFCFVLDVSEPGLLVVKHRRIGGLGKFTNVAVLKGDVVKIVDEGSASLPDCPKLLSSLLGFMSTPFRDSSMNVLVQLAVSMRAHGRGGLLLMVPDGSENWRNSIIHPIMYAISPAFSGLADQIRTESGRQDLSLWQGVLRREVDNVAGLTALDGATVISSNYEVLAFGAKIKRAQNSEQVEQMVVTEPVMGNDPLVVNPAQHGGTRHLSAAQFVHDQRDALALVASQDGRFTIFAWSPCENMVHAHRIDALLL